MKPAIRKAFLVRHGVTLQEIADALEVDCSAVSHTIAGRRANPDLQGRITDYLRTRLPRRVPDLFGRPPQHPPPP